MREQIIGRTIQDDFTREEIVNIIPKLSGQVILDVSSDEKIKISNMDIVPVSEEITDMESLIELLRVNKIDRGQYSIVIKENGQVFFNRFKKRWIQK